MTVSSTVRRIRLRDVGRRAGRSPAQSRGAGELQFLARPYVCGALGPWDPAVLDRLRAASPPGLRDVVAAPEVAVLATGELHQWGRPDVTGYSWGALADGREPTSWVDASESRLAAGIQIDRDGCLLHTDALGLQELFVRELGPAVYFAVRIDPLACLDDAPLHVDWGAWASVLAITCPVGDATQFREIRRVGAASAVQVGRTGWRHRSYEPRWLSVEPDPRVRAATAIDAVAGALPRGGRGAVLLSGGWDSRLLATLAARDGSAREAWTTSKDDGRDRDVALAGPVARALRLRHRVVLPPPEAWLDEIHGVRHRLMFQTNHHAWLAPVARAARGRRVRFIDGLAGDVLFKGSTFSWPSVDTDGLPAKRRVMWESLDQGRLRRRHLFAPGVAAALEDFSRAAFDSVARRFDGHVEAANLMHLHTRAARAISLAPQWILGPELDVVVPFLHPDVLRVAFSVPLARKRGGGFYREMLVAADPAVAALPSTHDAKPGPRNRVPRHRSPRALQALATSIRAQEQVLALLSPEMRVALRDPDALDLLGRTNAGIYLLQWAALLAEWCATYGSRLADTALLDT